MFCLTGLIAQDTAEKKWVIKTDSGLTTTDGKIVTIGEPVSVKPLTTIDKAALFFKAAYEKYPVWCWVAGFFIVLSVMQLARRLFTRK